MSEQHEEIAKKLFKALVSVCHVVEAQLLHFAVNNWQKEDGIGAFDYATSTIDEAAEVLFPELMEAYREEQCEE